MFTQGGNLLGQGLGQLFKPPLPGAPRGETGRFRKGGVSTGPSPGWVAPTPLNNSWTFDRCRTIMITQGFEKQPIAIGGWPASAPPARRRRRRQAVDQLQHRDKRQAMRYHTSYLRVMDWCGNLYDAAPAAVDASRCAAFSYSPYEL